jgi:hypothetical protein
MASGSQAMSRAGGARAVSTRWRAVEGAGVSEGSTALVIRRTGAVECAEAAAMAVLEIRLALHRGQFATPCWLVESEWVGVVSAAWTAGEDPWPERSSGACPRPPLAAPSSTSENASASPRGVASPLVPYFTAAIPMRAQSTRPIIALSDDKGSDRIPAPPSIECEEFVQLDSATANPCYFAEPDSE